MLYQYLDGTRTATHHEPAAAAEPYKKSFCNNITTRQLFLISLDDNADHFRELVAFIAQVAVCYPKETADFASHLIDLLAAPVSHATRSCRTSSQK